MNELAHCFWRTFLGRDDFDMKLVPPKTKIAWVVVSEAQNKCVQQKIYSRNLPSYFLLTHLKTEYFL